MAQQGIDVDPRVGQQPVHLLDRVLGQAPTGQRQALIDHADRERGALDHPQRGPGQGKDALGMQVWREKRLQELMDALERERLLRRHGVVPCIGSRVQNRILVRLPSPLNCLSPVKRQTCRLESLTASHPIIHPARPRTSSKRNEGMHEPSDP